MKTTSVLIIGGGPVGLSMALALARQGIPSMLIERHPSITNHPKARGVTVRTMELFRKWGNAAEIMSCEQPKEAIRFIWATSLQGEEIARITPAGITTNQESPARMSFVSQDHVEASLYHTLQDYPQTEVHFSKEFLSFQEDDEGITAHLLNKKNRQQESIRANYLIAADGARSLIQRQLGIKMKGVENLGRSCSFYCEMDLSPWTRDRPAISFLFTDPQFSGRLLLSVDNTARWIMGMRFAENDTPEKFSDAYCLEETKRVLGLPDLKIKILSKNFWTMAALNATRYHQGKIFLMGDAAHVLPPTGGFGMNTGIQDAHNLAWKLAFVLKGHASEKLLDTYFEERAPIVRQNILWSQKNEKCYREINAAIAANNKELLISKFQEQQKNLTCTGLDLGFIYHSQTIFSENDSCLSSTPAHYQPTTLPGSRAPHCSLLRDGQFISTLDLFEKEFVLLVGSEGSSWLTALEEIKNETSLPLSGYRVADGDVLSDPEKRWQELYEISATGAVLIRPDGHVAWRSEALVPQPKEMLAKIISTVCGK